MEELFWILLGIYIVFGPVIFFAMTNGKISALSKKVKLLETQVKGLREKLAVYEKKARAEFNENAFQKAAFDQTELKQEELENSIQDHTYKEAGQQKTKADISQPVFTDYQAIKEQYASIKTEFADSKQQANIEQSPDNQTETADKQKEAVKEKIKKPLKVKPKREFNLEKVIGKLGSLLLLIGIAFVYKLAYDNGYISDFITIVIGYVISFAILSAGRYFITKKRLILSQILTGTAYAACFITTFAAHLHYGLIDNITAFLILLITSLFIFAYSYKHNFQIVASIATAFSICVPFIVEMSFVGILGFGIYLACISLLAMTIYGFKKWHVLQITNAVSILLALFLLVYQQINSVNPDLLKIAALIIVESLIIAIPDIILYIKDKKDFIPLKSILMQSINYLLTFVLLLLLNYFTDKEVASIFALYALIYGLATYLAHKRYAFTNFVKMLYLLFVASIVMATTLFFANFHLGIALLAVSVGLILIDKQIKHKLSLVMANIVYYFSLITNIVDIEGEETMIIAIILIASLVLIILADRFLRTENKSKFRFVSYQLYISIFLNWSIILINGAFIYELSHLFTQFLILNIALFTIYELIDYKLQIFGQKNNLTILVINTCFNIFTLTQGLIFADFIFGGRNQLGDSMGLFDLAVPILAVLIIFALLKITKDKSRQYMYFLNAFIIIQAFALYHVSYYVDDFRYGLLLSSLIIVGWDIYNKKYAKIEDKKALLILDISKYSSITLNIGFYAFIYPFKYLEESFEFLPLLINSINMKLLYQNLKVIKSNKYIRYVVSSIMIIYLSYIHVYIPTEGAHYVSLIWAAYVIYNFIHYLRKSDIKMVNLSIYTLILIVAKFVIIDLKTASLISKVITSIVFGSALLALSYLMPRLIKNYGKEDSDSEEK